MKIPVYNINGRTAFTKDGVITLFKKEYDNNPNQVIQDIEQSGLFTQSELQTLVTQACLINSNYKI